MNNILLYLCFPRCTINNINVTINTLAEKKVSVIFPDNPEARRISFWTQHVSKQNIICRL